MLKRLAAAVLLAALLATCLTQQTASAKTLPADPTAGADGETVWGRNADNEEADPDEAAGTGKSGRQPSAPPARTTPVEPCAGHQIINNRNKCDLVKHNKTDNTPTEAQLREVIAKLKLPNPTPRLGPDPSVNEWNMLVVGYPIWLWTDQPTHLSTTAKHDGLTFTLDATHNHTTFTMGDGTTKTCTQTTVRPTNPVANTSPACGHTYQHTSPKNHPYTITATTTWTITWQTGTHHGTLTHTTTGTCTLEVGELHNLIVG